MKDPVHVHDLQATVLHALGLDHLRLVTRYQGRDFRLTDVAGNVLKPLVPRQTAQGRNDGADYVDQQADELEPTGQGLADFSLAVFRVPAFERDDRCRNAPTRRGSSPDARYERIAASASAE